MDDVSRYYFEKQLLFSMTHQRYTDCPYYPCHKMTEQNCFFCYCPFYPCQDETKGVWLSTAEKKIWDCSLCQWIHTDRIVKRIIELLYEGMNIPEIKEVLVKEYLW
ncbi:MAG: cysteine-rich small domain-containing protein [Brevinematales bacterium]